MADTEIKQVIKIDTGEAITSLKEYKAHMEELKGKLLGLEKGTEEYNKTANEVAKQQNKLNEVLSDSKYGVDGVKNSYNSLQAQLSQLKKEWKQMDMGSEEWKKTAEQINELNDKLKDADAQTGNFQRNVGNYANSFVDAFTKMSNSAAALNNPLKIASAGIKTFGAALKTLAANPIGAIIMAIVVAVKALKKGFEGSEEATNSLKRAFAALQPVLNAVNNLFTSFAKIVGSILEHTIPPLMNGIQKVGEFTMTLLNKIGIVSDERLKQYKDNIQAQKEMLSVTQNLTNREIALVKKKRQAEIETAQLEYQVSELRAKAADKEANSNEERIKALDEAISKEKQINAIKLGVAQEEFDIMRERAKLTDNDVQTNDALAQAEANLWNVRKEVNEKNRELITQRNEALRALRQEEGNLIETDLDLIDIDLDLIDAEESIVDAAILSKEAFEAKKSQIDGQIKLVDSYLSVVKKGSEEEVRLLKEKEDLTYKLSVAESKYRIKDTEELNATLENLMEAHYNNVAKINQEAYQASIDLQNKQKENAVKEVEMAYGENDLRTYDAKIEAYQFYLDTMRQMQDESNEDYKTRQLEAEDNLNNEIRAKLNQRISNYSNLASGIGDIMGTIADIYEEDINNRLERGEISEEEAQKEFETAKKIEIAQATIQMLTGIVAAVSGLFTTKTGPWDIALAAVQAASIAAAGIANIAKIKNTQLGSNSSTAGVTSVSSPTAIPRATDYTPLYTSNITGYNEQDNLNTGLANTLLQTPIYVSVTEINDVQNKVKVRENEATF